MKFKYLTVIVLTANYFSAQNGKVGIATATPTENFDVNGTMRVRSLPNNGTANAIYTTGPNTNSGDTPTQTFNGLYPVLSDANGVLGKTTTAELINNNTVTDFNTTNTSTAAFIIKRYTLNDTTGGNNGTYNNNNGYDTGMSASEWQAIMSSASFRINSTAPTSPATAGPFVANSNFNYRLKITNGTWRIIGDIRSVTETGIFDILFIKSKFVAADDRSN